MSNHILKRYMINSALILEDENIISLLLYRILESEGIDEVMVAQDVGKGVSLSLEMEPDLIITDYHLSNNNAIEMIKELKERYYPKELPEILIISGDHIDVDILFEVGLSKKNFMTKPFQRRDVVNYLGSLRLQKS